MASPAVGRSATSIPNADPNALLAQKLRLEQAIKSSSSWFVVIAGLSLVNSVLAMTGTTVHFIFGLGFTQIVDALTHTAGGAGYVLDFMVNGIVAGVFVLFWNFARKGQKWAFVVGMSVYIMDALILLPFKDFLSIAFHAWALYRMYAGLKLIPALERLERASASGTISSSL